MDQEAMMRAAAQDPRLAQFMQQAAQGVQVSGPSPQEIMQQLAGLIGTAKPPQFAPFAEDAPLPVFEGASAAVDNLFGPKDAPAPPMPPGPIFGPQGAGAGQPQGGSPLGASSPTPIASAPLAPQFDGSGAISRPMLPGGVIPGAPGGGSYPGMQPQMPGGAPMPEQDLISMALAALGGR